MRAARQPRPADAGFTLLELMAAITIFSIMAGMVLVSLQDSTEMALTSVRARELRILAERKMGEILLFEAEFDDIYDNERFDDYDDELYDGWEWSLLIRDVVIYGDTNDEAAEFLFEDPGEDDETDPAATDAGAEEQKGETQFLRELSLTVRAPTDDGEGGDSVTIITFVPLVDHGPGGAAGGAAGGAGGNGGQGGN